MEMAAQRSLAAATRLVRCVCLCAYAGIWNFCTIDQNTMHAFAFDLYDLDGDGTLSHEALLVRLRRLLPAADARER